MPPLPATPPSPKVTIVTGYYKRADVVERTLRSLLEQTFTDFELIVFDDASPDNTAERLEEFVKNANDPRIIPIYHKKNVGFVNGLIHAIGRAKGQYIAIQGSGDISLPTRLEKQVAILDGSPQVGVVGCDIAHITEDLKAIRINRISQKKRGAYAFSHGEVMYRKALYEKVGGYRQQFTFAPDVDLWRRMRKVCSFAYVPEVLYYRFTLGGGVSYSPEKVVDQKRFDILAGRLDSLPPERQQELLSKISRDNLANLVPLNTTDLQRKLRRAALSGLLNGHPALTSALLSPQIILSPFFRFFSYPFLMIATYLPSTWEIVLRIAAGRRQLSQQEKNYILNLSRKVK